jgi:hypothetical protein
MPTRVTRPWSLIVDDNGETLVPYPRHDIFNDIINSIKECVDVNMNEER